MPNILLVIVIYKTNLFISKTFQTFINKCHNTFLFVYDNSPIAQSINNPNIYYLHDKGNSGLSVAYNKAANYAIKKNFKWLLLLDQDTDFSGLSIKDYENAILNNPEIKIFAPHIKCGEKFMSPVKVWNKMMKLQNYVPTGIINLSKYTLINSGICVNVDAMIECGGYNDKVFLDYSDFEFLEKFKRKYTKAFIIDKDITQNLSVFSDNKDTTINRYRLYCKSIKNCERCCFSDNFWFLTLVLKRGLSICLKKITIKPILIFFSEYL